MGMYVLRRDEMVVCYYLYFVDRLHFHCSYQSTFLSYFCSFLIVFNLKGGFSVNERGNSDEGFCKQPLHQNIPPSHNAKLQNSGTFFNVIFIIFK